MEVKTDEPVRKKSSNDVMRKKLEAELRATEEIARIRQNVIEKRLAVELASLETEPPDGAKAEEGSKVAALQKPVPKPLPKPVPKPVPKPAPPPAVADPRKARTLKKPAEPQREEVEEEATTSAFTGVKLQKSPFSLRFRRSLDKCPKSSIITPSFRTFSRKHQLPEFFTPYHPDDSGDEEEDEDEEEEDEESQPRRKGSFLKGVIQKWKKKMRPEEKDKERE